jgi:hypothetical protein
VLHTSLFNNILSDTDSPALALQAYFTSIARSVYYTWLPFFDSKGNATIIYYDNHQAPDSKFGFWMVTGYLTVHFFLVATITVKFFTRTKVSLIGETWPAFAQVAGFQEVQAVVQAAAAFWTDKEVVKLIEKNSSMQGRFRINYVMKKKSIDTVAEVKKDEAKEALLQNVDGESGASRAATA